ncbi:hypothetical protein SNK03_13622 [Fusarium graminearum]
MGQQTSPSTLGVGQGIFTKSSFSYRHLFPRKDELTADSHAKSQQNVELATDYPTLRLDTTQSDRDPIRSGLQALLATTMCTALKSLSHISSLRMY